MRAFLHDSLLNLGAFWTEIACVSHCEAEQDLVITMDFEQLVLTAAESTVGAALRSVN